MKKVAVIGSGFAGLSASACLAQSGFDVTVFEKNATAGGRARKFECDGYVFDMGPSWYWMPDVLEKFFRRFGKGVEEFYELKRLDPSYRVFFGNNDFIDVPAGVPALKELFEKLEPGSGKALAKFLDDGAFKYNAGMNDLVYKPGLSWRELADTKLVASAFRLNLFQSHSKYVRSLFRNPRLISILEFPVLFLGASPDRIPALYSLMNYADMALGTWYPMGGMYRIVEGMTKLAEELGVKFRFNTPVSRVVVDDGSASGIWSDVKFFTTDFVVASADYQHVENDLLPADMRRYSNDYWNSRILAPSCLIFYLGINKRIANLQHHNLFFDEDIQLHTHEIYSDPRWPSSPQFYVCCPSKTDHSVAPTGCENLFILMPVAAGLDDEETIRDKYFSLIIRRLEHITGESILPHIVFRKSYAHKDFSLDYNAFKGNAYGLANTLLQTANLKPAIKSNKVDNLYYAGQLTVPGPGVPPAIISGQVVAAALANSHQNKSGQKQIAKAVVK